MAGIGTSIKLNDQMSAILDSITEATNRTTASWQNLDNATSSGLVASGIDAVGSKLDKINESTRKIVDKQEQHTQKIRESSSAASDLLSKIKKVVGGMALGAAVKKTINLSDELTLTTARLDMMNDGAQTTSELFNKVYQAAQRSRGSVSDMADVVARFGNNAKDAFSSNDEVIAFSEIVQKQMTIAGASTAEASNAMLQLSQALGSGVLRGDELNSIFEQAPNLIQSIAKYLDVPIGQIREMASEGQLSADVVKAAIFASADDVNAKFESMPMTFSQIWQKFKNSALTAFQPVLNRINSIMNSPEFQAGVESAIIAITNFANIALSAFDMISNVVKWFTDRLEWIAPVLATVVAAILAYKIACGVATLAQQAWNAVMYASPITWILVLIIAIISAIILVCKWIANTTDVANSALGVIGGGIFWIGSLFKNVGLSIANFAIGIFDSFLAICTNIGKAFKNTGLTIANIGLGIWEVLKAVVENIKTAFHNAICGVQAVFWSLLSTVMSVVEGICAALNKIPFIEFDYSGITSKAQEYANKAAEAEGNKGEYVNLGDAFDKGMSTYQLDNEWASVSDAYASGADTFDAFTEGWGSDAFAKGAKWGDNLTDKISDATDGFFTTGDGSLFASDALSVLTGNTNDIAGNTSDTAKALNVANEDLKYMRDIAERDVINRFTTAEVKVDMGGVNNTVNQNTDLDGVISYLASNVADALDSVREGVAYT